MSTTTSSTSKRIVVRGACPHDCPDTCATLTEVHDGDGARALLRATPTTRSRSGWLCAKVRPYLDHVYHPDRLLHPLRRVGPKGARRVASASPGTRPSPRSLAAGRRIIAEYGAAAILPYSLQRHARPGATARRQRAALEPHGRERACSARSAARRRRRRSRRRSARAGRPTQRTSLHSKLILLWGHNPASTGAALHAVPARGAAQRRATSSSSIRAAPSPRARPTSTSRRARRPTARWRWA